jgi:non-homologous end joining protein Ku
LIATTVHDHLANLDAMTAANALCDAAADVLAESMIGKMNMVAPGRVVLSRREHLTALEPRDRGRLGLTLRYPYEVRDQAEYFEDIPELKLSKEMLDLATHIVKADPVVAEASIVAWEERPA